MSRFLILLHGNLKTIEGRSGFVGRFNERESLWRAQDRCCSRVGGVVQALHEAGDKRPASGWCGAYGPVEVDHVPAREVIGATFGTPKTSRGRWMRSTRAQRAR